MTTLRFHFSAGKCVSVYRKQTHTPMFKIPAVDISTEWFIVIDPFCCTGLVKMIAVKRRYRLGLGVLFWLDL